MKTTVTTKMTEWKTNASNKLTEIKTNFTTKVNEYKTTISNGWENMKTTITTKMGEWVTVVFMFSHPSETFVFISFVFSENFDLSSVNFPPVIGQAASKVFNGVKETVSRLTSAATETVKQNLSNMKKAYEDSLTLQYLMLFVLPSLLLSLPFLPRLQPYEPQSLLPLGNELLRLGKDIMPTVKAVVGDVTNPVADLPKLTANVAAFFPALNAFAPNVFITGAAFEPKSRIFFTCSGIRAFIQQIGDIQKCSK